MNYDSDGNITNIVSSALANRRIAQNTQDFAREIFAELDAGTLTSEIIDALVRQYEDLDEGIVRATRDLEAGRLVTSDYQQLVGDTTTRLMSFTEALKGMALNMGAMLAVMIAVKAVTFIVDEAITTFEEQKEIVDDLTTSVSELQSEYDNLKLDPSTSGVKLTELKKRLEYQKELLAVEKEKLALKDIDENMSDSGTSTVALENSLNTFNKTKKEIEKLETEGYGNDRIKEIYAEQYENNVDVLTAQIDSAKEEYIPPFDLEGVV